MLLRTNEYIQTLSILMQYLCQVKVIDYKLLDAHLHRFISFEWLFIELIILMRN